MKFVSYGEDVEPEITSEDIVDGHLTGEVRVVLDCAECGGELKEANIEYEKEIEHDCRDSEDDDELEFEIQDTSATLDSRLQDKDRHGKPIKNSRYMKMFYGADISTTVKCMKCGADDIEVQVSVEEQASYFEELQ